LGELALGREAVTRLELAVGDQELDLADDLLVDPRRADGLELHPARRGVAVRIAVGGRRRLHARRESRRSCRAGRASHQPSAERVTANAMARGYSSAWAATPSLVATTGSCSTISPATHASTPPPSQTIQGYLAMSRARSPLPTITMGIELAMPIA